VCLFGNFFLLPDVFTSGIFLKGSFYGKWQKKEQTGHLYIERIRASGRDCSGTGGGYAWQHQD
jgi:hypothetical protein